MKRDDSVFFFTLVDFLVTTLFFGVVLFALKRHGGQKGTPEAQLERAIKAAGVSNITELTDELTRLAPLKEAAAKAMAAQRLGDSATITEVGRLVQQSGGIDSLRVAVARFRGEGYGKPPCVFVTDAEGKKHPVSVARIEATDTSLIFVSSTPHMDSVLTIVGRSLPAVRSLRPAEFRMAFAKLVDRKPDCRYYVDYVEHTRYVEPLHAVQSGFRTQMVP